MTSPRPNLFLVGAMKSGTTSLHHYLGAHPEIFMSDPKEPRFFSNPDLWPGGEREYVASFAAGAGCAYRGESSTAYAKAPRVDGVARRIARFEPSARILYLMRDPVERAVSHYWHWWKSGRELRPMDVAFRETADYTDFGDYAFQLERYLKAFPRAQVFTLTTEALAREPAKELRRCFVWLGVDPGFAPPNLGLRYHETGRFVKKLDTLIISTLRRLRIRIGLPPPPERLRVLLLQATGAALDRERVSTEAAIAYLRPRLLDRTRRLSDLLGRSFPEWRTLHGTGLPT